MAAVDPKTLMWTKACEMIDRAEGLHRQFFQPTAAPTRTPATSSVESRKPRAIADGSAVGR